MIYFFKKLKSYKLQATSYKLNAGMTYVELIVVLSIFSVLSSVAIYNYGSFQSRVDIKNVASDIALKIVEAQKSAINGVLPLSGGYNTDTWKPSYGIHFDVSSKLGAFGFLYFADFNNNNNFDDSNCTGECLEYITITKGNYINKIESFTNSISTPIADTLTVTFKRPNSSAVFIYEGSKPLIGIDYVQITINSPSEAVALIKIYPSGRIQVGSSLTASSKETIITTLEEEIPPPPPPPPEELF